MRIQLFTAVVVLAGAKTDETAAVLYGAAPRRNLVAMGWTDQDYAAGAEVPLFQRRFLQATADLRSRLGEDRFLALADRGGQMNDDEVVDLIRQTVSRFLAVPQPST
jgi:hypothetical protein